MSQYNNKGMASDLSLGRPSTSANDTSMAAAATSRHANYLQHPTDVQKEFRDDAEYESNIIAGLERYVRALQGEREKLDAFRRELPICMSLLDDAIQASSQKLTKAVASSRMVACQASYSNYGSPAYAANMSNKGAGVHSNLPREQQASMFSSWGSALGSQPHAHAHAHASDHDEQLEKHQPSFKDTHMTHPHAHHMTMFAAAAPPPPPPHFATASHLHLVNYPHSQNPSNNMFLNKLQQKEGTLFNQGNEMMRQSAKTTEGFNNTLEFSSSKIHEDEHIMVAREAGGIVTAQTPRKARRCWSPELHQRFLHALHQLGGPQLATPKQIREVMHVEGLTNDEVKSHLQKFRLHTRRPAPIPPSEPAQQPHHLVLFGGIWVPTSPAESAPAAQLAACQLAGSGHATSSGNHNPYVPFQHVIGQSPMQSLMRATTSEQLDVHAGMEAASEVDVARSDQSTSQNGGFENTLHEEEDTEIHLGSKPIISREITSPIAKARYQ